MDRAGGNRGWATVALGAGTLALAVAIAMAAATRQPAGQAADELVGLDGLDLTPYRNVTVGDVSTDRFDPDAYLVDELESRTEILPDGRTLRIFEVEAINKEIEIAPGVLFPAWTFNGQVPGPTLRARAGEREKVRAGGPAD